MNQEINTETSHCKGFKRLFFITLSVFFSFLFIANSNHTYAGTDNLTSVQLQSPQLRISILTCGVGTELYASFGHSGIRIIDSVEGTDDVYNYGTFDFGDPDFYTKFTLGKLLYYIDKSSFDRFMYGYEIEERLVQEQVLDLPKEEKEKIYDFLEDNLLPENRYYRYDFLFDNCATRIRDIFPNILGNRFSFAEVKGHDELSFRNVLNNYMADKHWERLGINLLLGRPADKKMTNDETMFLPDYLFESLQGATFDSKPVVASSGYLLSHTVQNTRRFNGPLWLSMAIFVLTALSFHLRAFYYLKGILQFILLFVTGLLGSMMLFMWFGSDHAAMSDNYNILWAMPLNLIVAFAAIKKRKWLKYYGAFATACIILVLIAHLTGFQKMPLIELIPILMSLLYFYSDFWKKSSLKKATS